MPFMKEFEYCKINKWESYYTDQDSLENAIGYDGRSAQPQEILKHLHSHFRKPITFIKAVLERLHAAVDEYETMVQQENNRRVEVNGQILSGPAYWKYMLDEVEAVTLDLCLLEKFTASHRRLMEAINAALSQSGVLDIKISDTMEQIWADLFLDKTVVNDILTKLSIIYNLIRNAGDLEKPDKKKLSNQNFVRKSIKYWVHPDYVTELKALILRHLPINVFKPKDGSSYNPAISSIYYDNSNMGLYMGRLLKTDQAIAIRYRWYGDVTNKEIFAERKTHHEDWTGDNSVKQRFALDECNVNAFNAGQYTLDNKIRQLRAEGKKSEKELNEMETLSREYQQAIKERRLVPTMRTFYNRTAFQLPDDARVRISLDTELTFIREDEGRAKGNWRRTDIGINWPFEDLKENEVVRFPYAVLEVKLQTHIGQEPPAWVTEIQNSHLVEETPKFSKFCHGCATLIPHRIPRNPYWFNQMHVDIRAPIHVPTVIENTPTKVFLPFDPSTREENNPEIQIKISQMKKKERKIKRPTRVEPKVHMANERIFLQYINVGVLLAGCSLSLIMYGVSKTSYKLFSHKMFDFIGITSVIYTFVGLLFMIYSLSIYHKRSLKITRNPNREPLDNTKGIYIIFALVCLAIILNLIMLFIRPKEEYV